MRAVQGLYAGKIRALAPDGERSGIFKTPVAHAQLDTEGLIGDHQADRRVHGGPQMAVHQFSQASYLAIVQAFPALDGKAVPGSMGENLSIADMDENNVHIGDSYQIGGVILQVSQPRSPCWKINHRFGEEKLAGFIARQRLCGWYYRVLQPGRMAVGDVVTHIERPAGSVSVDAFLSLSGRHRRPRAELEQMRDCPGLSPEWQQRMQQRVDVTQGLSKS